MVASARVITQMFYNWPYKLLTSYDEAILKIGYPDRRRDLGEVYKFLASINYTGNPTLYCIYTRKFSLTKNVIV